MNVFVFFFKFTSNFVSIIISYVTSAATSNYSKMIKSLIHRCFSFSNKVFYPVASFMNGLQHLTTQTSLEFFLSLCYSFGPNSSKFGPSCPQVGPNFFHLVKEMATTFVEPERTLCMPLSTLLQSYHGDRSHIHLFPPFHKFYKY